MKIVALSLVTIALLANMCSPNSNSNTNSDVKGTTVVMKTTKGDMTLLLYDKTPQHRDNFVKLAKDGFYDSLLFHRVIEEFMIQGGDPDSKKAAAGQPLGSGGPGYTVPAEFDTTLFHKKGALSAARMGDQMNPTKASSGSQFYIVQGKTYTDDQLNQMEAQANQMAVDAVLGKYLQKTPAAAAKLDSFRKAMDRPGFEKYVDDLRKSLEPEIQKLPLLKFSPKQREVYKTVGGTPFLDNNYTVYGEVIDGLSVIDSIAAVQKDQNDRPLQDVRILSVKVKD